MDVCDHRREGEKCSLTIEGLRAYGQVRLQATGVSMLPTLVPGDVLHIQSAAFENVSPGDIVLYERNDALFIHRVIKIDLALQQLTTRGDSMAAADPDGPKLLLGRVIGLERGGRVHSVSRHRSAMTKFVGLLLFYSPRLRSLFLRLRSGNPASRLPVESLAGGD